MTIQVTAIVFGGHKVEFTKGEIQEMISQIHLYREADNLPKWLFASGHCNYSETSMKAKLKELKDGDPIQIDVRYHYKG